MTIKKKKTSKKSYNLLITHDTGHVGTAKNEILEIFSELKINPDLQETDVDGVILARVTNPKKTISGLSELLSKNPAVFMVTHHYVPIDMWVKASQDNLVRTIKKLAKEIASEETWKINISKRMYSQNNSKLVALLAEKITNPNVDLDNPDKIIQVEILGEKAGLSILTNEQLFNSKR